MRYIFGDIGKPQEEEGGVDTTCTKLRDHLFMSLNNLRQEEFLCDVTLLVGPAKVPMKAHRIILSCFSEYFKGMFSSGTKESSQKEIHLPTIDSESMKVMLDYVYSGKANLTNDNVHRGVINASFFGSELLVDKCSEIIKTSVNKKIQ